MKLAVTVCNRHWLEPRGRGFKLIPPQKLNIWNQCSHDEDVRKSKLGHIEHFLFLTSVLDHLLRSSLAPSKNRMSKFFKSMLRHVQICLYFM